MPQVWYYNGLHEGVRGEREVDLIVQALNPVTKRWIKIDTRMGCIIGHKQTLGAYKGIKRLNKYSNEEMSCLEVEKIDEYCGRYNIKRSELQKYVADKCYKLRGGGFIHMKEGKENARS